MPSNKDIELGKLLIKKGLLSRIETQRYLTEIEQLRQSDKKITLESFLIKENILTKAELDKVRTPTKNRTVHCNKCNTMYRVIDEDIGKKFKCKQCGTIVQVPKPGETEIKVVKVAPKAPSEPDIDTQKVIPGRLDHSGKIKPLPRDVFPEDSLPLAKSPQPTTEPAKATTSKPPNSLPESSKATSKASIKPTESSLIKPPAESPKPTPTKSALPPKPPIKKSEPEFTIMLDLDDEDSMEEEQEAQAENILFSKPAFSMSPPKNSEDKKIEITIEDEPVEEMQLESESVVSNEREFSSDELGQQDSNFTMQENTNEDSQEDNFVLNIEESSNIAPPVQVDEAESNDVRIELKNLSSVDIPKEVSQTPIPIVLETQKPKPPAKHGGPDLTIVLDLDDDDDEEDNIIPRIGFPNQPNPSARSKQDFNRQKVNEEEFEVKTDIQGIFAEPTKVADVDYLTQEEQTNLSAWAESPSAISQSSIGYQKLDEFSIVRLLSKGLITDTYEILIKADRFALRVLHPDMINECMELENEVAIASQLNHHSLIKIYGTTIYQDCPCYVTQYLQQAETLSQSWPKFSSSKTTAIEIALELLYALSYIHSQNIIHGYLDWENILLHQQQPYIQDMGLYCLHRQKIGIQMMEAKFSPICMSPEQLKNVLGIENTTPVDRRSDIYSVGVILYWMATGKIPFDSQQELDVLCDQIYHQKPLPPVEFDTEISAVLSYIIMKALEKNPAQRYASANEMIAELSELR